MRSLAMAAVAALVLAGPAWAGERIELTKLPKPVAEATAKRFPKAEAKSASKDGVGDKTMYEVTLKEGGKNIDVSLTAAGAITQIEQEVVFKDLPKAVAGTFEKKYPKATYKIIEAVITVKDGEETLEYYEAILVTADKKTFEAEVLPDGKLKGETEKTEMKPEEQCGDDKKGEEKKGRKKDDEDEKGEKAVELPKPVAGAVKTKFPGSKVVGASKEGKGEKAVYEVELRYKAATLEVILTAKGEVVEVEVKDKKKEEDEKGEKNEKGDKGNDKKGQKDEDNDKGEKGKKKKEDGDQRGFQGKQKGQHEDKDDKKGEEKKGKKKDDDKNEKGNKKKG